MGQALYRKHRPKKLSEVIGQEHITKTLEQALKQGRISHAYLFTGPRGVGKTSIARILAHEINDLPYTDDASHMDIIEIDAASNRRIDEIRELRDKVHVAPTSAKYKVYIIDEVHMLTREAFNALLKTLEEPPAHAVFILATTDAHKLPETIVSRTQRFSFRPVEQAKVVAHLKQLADAEKITVSDEALELLAKHGEGSFRDSISLLDQASSHGEALELASVQRLLGLPPDEAIQSVLAALQDSPAKLMGNLTSLYEQGFQAVAIARELGQSLRIQLIAGQSPLTHDQTIQLLSQLIEVPAAYDPERSLEIILLQAQSNPETSSSELKQLADKQEKQPSKQTEKPAPTPVNPAPAVTQSAKPSPENKKRSQPAVVHKSQKIVPFDEAVWPEILQALKQQHNTIYSVVRMAQPEFSDKGLTLKFAFAFHQKRINEASNRTLLADIIQGITGQAVTVECELDKAATPPKAKPTPVSAETAPKADISAISNIFGGGELLES